MNIQHKYPEIIVVIQTQRWRYQRTKCRYRCGRGRYVNFMDSDDKLTLIHFLPSMTFLLSMIKRWILFLFIFTSNKKTELHRLNPKYVSDSAGHDLTTHYSYDRCHQHLLFKREALNDHTFDTSLRYRQEDSKAIMELLLENPQYGIVPTGALPVSCPYIHEFCLNGSKSHREWYIDCLKNYIFWALAERKSCP